MHMSRITRHFLIPAFAPLIFLAIALTPVDVFGCRNRGLLALSVSLISGLPALAMAIIALKMRIRGDLNSVWWVASTLVMSIPVVAMIVLA
jgi:hypothetical protein